MANKLVKRIGTFVEIAAPLAMLWAIGAAMLWAVYKFGAAVWSGEIRLEWVAIIVAGIVVIWFHYRLRELEVTAESLAERVFQLEVDPRSPPDT